MQKWTLFEDLWSINDNKKLHELQNKYPEYDEMYLTVSVLKNCNKKKLRIKSMFDKNSKYLDSNFLSEFKIKWKFNSRLWELYLISFLLNKGFCLEKQKNIWPDIKILFWWKIIWIECISSSRWIWRNEIADMLDWYSGDIDIIDIPRKLRLTSAIVSKINKFDKYIKEWIVKTDDCYIIALNWWNSYWEMINNGIESILFWYWKTFFKKINWILKWPFVKNKKSLKNKNHSNVSNILFEKYKSISWIIYCWTDIVQSDDFDLSWKMENIYPIANLNLIKNPYSQALILDSFSLY
jgi:hypothetical protein